MKQQFTIFTRSCEFGRLLFWYAIATVINLFRI